MVLLGILVSPHIEIVYDSYIPTNNWKPTTWLETRDLSDLTAH